MMKRKPGTKKTSGKTGNRNAASHQAYLSGYDGRTWQGKLHQEIQAALTTALGGDPTPQQVLIIGRVAVKAIRCACLERKILGEAEISLETEKRYLRWSRELRNDLVTLGLDRRSRQVVDLKDYLEGNYEKD